MNVRKGDRITAQWMAARPACLAGMQMKLEAKLVSITGVVRHVRADQPIDPNVSLLYVDSDSEWNGDLVRPYGCLCEKGHIEVDPQQVVGIIP